MARQTETDPMKAASRVATQTKGRQISGKPAAGAKAQHPDHQIAIGADVRRHMIEEAAYYRAEKRGFRAGYELQDWLEAEVEIDMTLPQHDMH